MAKTAKRAAKKAAKKKQLGGKKRVAKKAGDSAISVKTDSPTSGEVARPLAPLEEMEKRFEDLLKRRWPRPCGDWPQWEDFSGLRVHRDLSVDVVDRKKEVLVRAEVPGIDKENLDISITDRTLTIKGSSRSEEKEERDDYFRREIRSGTFSRSILLPADVNAAKAKASFKDGLLELHLPKVRASKHHKIAVS